MPPGRSPLVGTVTAKDASGYGRWLHWLSAAGLCDPAIPPHERATRERVAAYVRHLHETVAPYTLISRIQDLHNALGFWHPRRICLAVAVVGDVAVESRASEKKRQRLRPADSLADLGSGSCSAPKLPRLVTPPSCRRIP